MIPDRSFLFRQIEKRNWSTFVCVSLSEIARTSHPRVSKIARLRGERGIISSTSLDTYRILQRRVALFPPRVDWRKGHYRVSFSIDADFLARRRRRRPPPPPSHRPCHGWKEGKGRAEWDVASWVWQTTGREKRRVASATDERSRRNGNAWGSSLPPSGSRVYTLEKAATAAAVVVDERKSENFLERKKWYSARFSRPLFPLPADARFPPLSLSPPCLFFRLFFPQRTRNPRRKSNVFHLRWSPCNGDPLHDPFPSRSILVIVPHLPFILLFFFFSFLLLLLLLVFLLSRWPFLRTRRTEEKSIALKIPFEAPLGNATPFIETLWWVGSGG